MNNKLIINFKQIENVVFAAPVNIPDWAKGINISYPENTYKYSVFAPIIYHLQIDEVLLYIPPEFSNMLFTPRCKFDNAEQAENWINYMNDAIEKLNTKYAGDENIIMKNEKLVVDIGIVENIVIIKVIDIPSIVFSATEIERCPNDPREDVTITLITSTKDKNLTSMYSYSIDVGDDWRFLFPTVEYCENITTKALTFSDAFKAKQFVKCFKAVVAKVNSQIESPLFEEETVITWDRCE